MTRSAVHFRLRASHVGVAALLLCMLLIAGYTFSLLFADSIATWRGPSSWDLPSSWSISRLLGQDSIQASSSKQYAHEYRSSVLGTSEIRFTEKASGIPAVSIGDDRASITLRYVPRTRSARPAYETETSGNTITYRDIEPYTNLIYTISDSGATVKEDIELTQKPLLTDDMTLSYSFDIILHGMEYQTAPDGSILPVFIDATGTEYAIPPLIMTDAAGKKSTDLTLLITQNDPTDRTRLTGLLTPNKEWIMSADRTYPVLIDPTLVRGNAPVYHWKMDEGYGGTTQDASASNADGTLGASTAAPTWQNEDMCISGKCLYFDGSNDYVDLGNIDAPIEGAGDFSFSFWMNPNNATAGVYQTILGTNDPSGYNVGWSLGMNYPNNGSICFSGDNIAGSPWGYSDCRDVGVTSNQWIFLTFTRTGSNVDWYVNGVKSGATGNMGASFANGAYNLRLGNSAAIRYFKGRIDDLKIYDYVRTADQIKADFVNRGGSYGVVTQFGKSSTTSGSNLTNGLVGYWKLDEPSGSAIDSSGIGNTGTIVGAVTAPGKHGTAIQFSGTNDRVTIPDATSINAATDLTVSAWINPSALLSASSHEYNELVNKGTYNSKGYLLYFGKAGGLLNFQWSWSGGTSSVVSQNFTYAANTWYHITATLNNTSGKIYINGVLNNAGAVTTPMSSSSGVQMVIGNDSAGTYGGQFPGTIDEVRVYNRALSESEVRALYSFAAPPVGSWNLNENSGTDANDTSGNSNTLTLTNTPSWTPGKLGSGVAFSGSDQHLLRADDPDFDFADDADMTVSTWFRHTTASAQEVILSKYNEAGYKIIMESDGDITCALDYDATWTPTDSVTSTTATYDDGNWHHIGCVKTGASNLKLYIDGILIGTDAAITATNTLTNSDPLYVGIDADGTSNDFTGSLDDIKIYNYARTSGQVVEDMNGGHPAPGSPVGSALAHYKFDEGYGTTAYDKSINANNLTLSTASWTNDGKYNKAWNGTNALWLSRADDNDFDFGVADDLSMGFWYRSDSATNPGAIEYIVNKASSTIAGYAVYAMTNGTICFGIDDDTTWGPDIASCSPNDIYDGTWHHITATRNTALDAIAIHVDGVLSDTDIDPTTATLTNSLSLYIGDRDGVNNGDEFAGDIDELKFYRSAFDTTQVRTERNAGKAQVMGSLSTASNGTTADNSSARSYCVPGDTSSCSAPILDWQFNEKTGTTTYDSAGGYSGTLAAGNTWVTGKFGPGVHGATGTTGYINAGAITPVRFTNSSTFTYSAWVKADAVSPAGNYSMVFKQDGGSGTFVYAVQAFGDNAAKICASVGKSYSVDYTACTPSNLVVGRWYYVTGVYASSVIKLYIDGNYITSATYVTSAASAPAGNFAIGGDPAAGNRYFDGSIDNLRIYNYARTPAQIAWEYNRGAPVAWYKFDECTGTSISDWGPNGSGGYNGNTGTLTIGASGSNTSAGTCSTSGAWYDGATGKVNSSMDFDGTDDYVSGTMNSSVNFSSLSASAWIKITNLPSSSDRDQIVSVYNSNEDDAVFTLNIAGDGGAVANRLQFLRFNAWASDGSHWDCTANSKCYVSAGQWIHVAVVHDSTTGYVYFYRDGVLVASYAARTGAWGAGGYDVTGPGFNIGKATGTSSAFDGLIDDVRMYNYPLTAAQVRDIYNGGAVSFK